MERLNRAFRDSVKFYRPRRKGEQVFAAAKSTKLQSEVVGWPILLLWLMISYFTGSVSWLTDLAPYLPQYGAGYYEEKMTQVSDKWLIHANTCFGDKKT